MEVAEARIHFGWYVGWLKKRLSLDNAGLGEKIGIGDKRAWDLQQMEEPEVHPDTYKLLAAMEGLSPEEFTVKWKSTPVKKPPKKGGRVIAIRLTEKSDGELIEGLNTIAEETDSNPRDVAVEMIRQGVAARASEKSSRISQTGTEPGFEFVGESR
jgi:hypothetical protein